MRASCLPEGHVQSETMGKDFLMGTLKYVESVFQRGKKNKSKFPCRFDWYLILLKSFMDNKEGSSHGEFIEVSLVKPQRTKTMD